VAARFPSTWQQRPIEATEESVRVLTLNLWNISEPLEARLAALVAGLNRLAPDIACFQEVSPHPQLSRLQSELVAQLCHFPHHVSNKIERIYLNL
jgi:hypothetical protein